MSHNKNIRLQNRENVESLELNPVPFKINTVGERKKKF